MNKEKRDGIEVEIEEGKEVEKEKRRKRAKYEERVEGTDVERYKRK